MPPLEASSGSRRVVRAPASARERAAERKQRLRPTAGTGDPAATSGVPAVLRTLDVRPSRRLGQNFLTDPRVAERIAALADEVDPQGAVVEIGPGLGALTERLARSGRAVVAVELDHRLAERVETVLAAHSASRVVQGDILEQELAVLLPGEAPVTVVANLPYSITTPAIEWVLAQGTRVRVAYLMVQREVAQRMTATPGGKEFGSLSVFLSLHAEIEGLFRVSPGAFYPRPEVDSVVVRMKPRPFPGTTVAERMDAERLARAATGGRRKTIGNALARGLGIAAEQSRELLRSSGIEATRRGESLSVEEWLTLARAWRAGGAAAGAPTDGGGQ
ncbi:MAG TPA: 16S rRNA (adenine(1518)-N(6)/adenine(1519)-N(6))-dimethyltransferase RsmA [Candidatus Eisenbacteria bacterium]|nr:16S rRNA (adenine(1518)-N(6)/adenine(1519)-N(6))-dimethyltransferase RsmA [Candidatus Eisenbacteria bacterium]